VGGGGEKPAAVPLIAAPGLAVQFQGWREPMNFGCSSIPRRGSQFKTFINQ